MVRIAVTAALVSALLMAAPAPASAATPLKTRITVEVPSTVTAGRSFIANAAAQLDYRLHRPRTDYLRAAMYYGGVSRCPKAVPFDVKSWELVAEHEYDAVRDPSVRVTFGGSVKFTKRGSHRFCAYVYLDHYSGGFLPSSHPVKARASKLVTAR